MKKIISVFIILIFLLLISIGILSTIGVETNRFNNLILNKINQSQRDVELDLNSIKFKLDIKEVSLFLETSDSTLNYRNAIIPTKNIKVYIDFFSILKSETRFEKISLISDKIDLKEFKKISFVLKPSTYKSFLNNNIQDGTIFLEIDFYLNKENNLENFISRGSVSDLDMKIIDNLVLNKSSFSFFADMSDVLIQNFKGEIDQIKIDRGDLKMNFSSEIFLETNFKTVAKLKKIGSYKNLNSRFKYLKNIEFLEAETINNLKLNLDKTYKLKNINLNSSGKINKAKIFLDKPINNYFGYEEINLIELLDTEIKTNINSKNTTINLLGKYSTDSKNFSKFQLKNYLENNNFDINLDADYEKELNLDLINYKKQKGKIANISLKLSKQKEFYIINEIKYLENKNSILINDIKFGKNKFLKLDKIIVKTYKNNVKNNDFTLQYGKKVKIKGSKFDANNLPKLYNQKSSINNFNKINKNIEIDLLDISAPLSEKLDNFKLIGRIDNGKFSKISAKGDFGNNNFLDISMKNDSKNKKKYLEIYSDLTRPLLTEYSFFKGLTGGKLLLTSIISENITISKLKIENFKVINAPGMIKLLSLADLGGLADLAKGEGISFDILEISMEKTNDLLKINEILALGPSISVFMEGYQDTSTTSLRGSLVPAKTLNKLISKIPVIGDIVIPKEVGEGIFGISFKIKGPPGKIKTTINPIRTITPRFIQKIIDKKKKVK